MRLDDCYRLLDLDSRASGEEVKRAHRDLTKVWHPDRFGHDAALRRKAEEKLKAINNAYETIQALRSGRNEHGEEGGTPAWAVRWRGREGRAAQRVSSRAAGGTSRKPREPRRPSSLRNTTSHASPYTL